MDMETNNQLVFLGHDLAMVGFLHLLGPFPNLRYQSEKTHRPILIVFLNMFDHESNMLIFGGIQRVCEFCERKTPAF